MKWSNRERERESVWVREWERVCVSEWERESLKLFLYISEVITVWNDLIERKRERE